MKCKKGLVMVGGMTRPASPLQTSAVAAEQKPVVRLRSARGLRRSLAWALAFSAMGTALAQPTSSTPTSSRQLENEQALMCAQSIQMTLYRNIAARINNQQSVTVIDREALKASEACILFEVDIKDVSNQSYPNFIVKNKLDESLYTVYSGTIFAVQSTVREAAGSKEAFDFMALECAKSLQSALSVLHQRYRTYPSTINKVVDGAGSFCTPSQIIVVGMATQNSYTFTVHDTRGATVYTATPDHITAPTP
jgi:hypothetical protein